MTSSEYIITYKRLDVHGEPKVESERKVEFTHAINAARSYRKFYIVASWTITRTSDGVVVAQYWDEFEPVRMTDAQAEALKVGIREAAGVHLNTGMLARKFAQIAAEEDEHARQLAAIVSSESALQDLFADFGGK